MRACSQIPECSLSYTKIMQGERNSKTEKRSFFRLDIAEPKLILYKEMKRTRKRAYYTVNLSLRLRSQCDRLFCHPEQKRFFLRPLP